MARSTPDPNPASQPPSTLSSLRYPIFRAVWIASTVSNLGGQIHAVGAAWMMTSLAESADMVALVQASVALPIMLLSLFAGAMADNLDRRGVMLGAQMFMLAVSVALAICAWTGLLTPWLLLLFTFLIGCGAAFNAPAWQASVGDMVPRGELPGAVTLNSMGFNIARSSGPAIGGVIVAAAGAAAAFAVNAVSYIALVVVLARWRRPPTTRLLPPETLRVAVTSGVRYVAMSPPIRVVLLRAVVFGGGASPVLALMPLVAKTRIDGGPMTYGSLLGAFGVGAVAGVMGASRLRRKLSTETFVRCACVGLAVATAVVGISSHLAVTMVALLLAGAGWVLTLSTFNVIVQLAAPRWVVARALSIYQMTTFGGMAAGSWLCGILAAHQGVDTSLLAAAAVLLACAALGGWRPLAQSEELNLDPLSQWKEPTTRSPVAPRSGPVVITTEYVIRDEDTVDFLKAMAERRRVRRRDGALKWRIMRDLADPEIWIERYETPTWLDYIRHSNRLTQHDAALSERILALHASPEPPRVRHMLERQTGTLPSTHAVDPPDLTEPLTDPTRSS